MATYNCRGSPSPSHTVPYSIDFHGIPAPSLFYLCYHSTNQLSAPAVSLSRLLYAAVCSAGKRTSAVSVLLSLHPLPAPPLSPPSHPLPSLLITTHRSEVLELTSPHSGSPFLFAHFKPSYTSFFFSSSYTLIHLCRSLFFLEQWKAIAMTRAPKNSLLAKPPMAALAIDSSKRCLPMMQGA